MPQTTANQIRLYFAGKRDDMSQADCYLHGVLVEKDIRTALMLYKRAASQGQTEAHFKIGSIYHHRQDKEEKAAKAYYQAFLHKNLLAKVALQELASSGKPIAQFYLGLVCEKEQNWLKAKEHYDLAIDGGYILAMLNMAKLYQADRKALASTEIILRKDVTEELRWYKQAAALGSQEGLIELEKRSRTFPRAAFYLAQTHELLEVFPKFKALEHYTYASENGCADASFRLGQLYEAGGLGLVRNPVKAVDYYLLATRQVHVQALTKAVELAQVIKNKDVDYKLAEFYFSQIQNKQLALSWYKQAADKEHAHASSKLYQIAAVDAEFAYGLGQLYESGAVGNRDAVKAYKSYARAMRNNHIEAKMHLESLAKEGNADAQYALGYEYYHQKSQVREAIQWCMAAADKKHVLAQNYLHQTQFSAGIYYEIAILYVHGEGAAVNLPQALLFYEKAAKTGISHAYFNMGVIFEKSLKDIGMAFNYYLQAAKARDVEAIGAVIRLARSSSNNDWLFQVAELYDKSLDDKGQALNWYRDAARLNSPKAWQALAKEGNASNVNAAIYLAELCESGHVSMRQHAAGWHARASELGDSNASFRLGQAYEKAELGLTVNCSKAGEYYARAVKQQHPEALKAFEKLVDTILKTKEFINAAEMSMAKELYFEFAELCFNQVRNKELALKWYKIAVDRGHKGAISKINNICKADPHFSYALGLQYETGAEGTRDELKAFYLYAFAMRNGHTEAKKNLEAKVKANNASAQYAIAHGYYHLEGRTREAVHLCMLAAEQGLANALAYLNASTFSVEILMEIANRYELGIEVEVNLERAISFFVKAYEAGKKDIALKLARLYEMKPGVYEENTKEACKYYILAAKQKRLEALGPLESLAVTASPDIQLAVAELYRSPFINNPMEALAWEQRAGRSSVAGFTSMTVSTLSTVRFIKPSAISSNPTALKALVDSLNPA